jgi:hypothetical protein
MVLSRSGIRVKGKEEMCTYFLLGLRANQAERARAV